MIGGAPLGGDYLGQGFPTVTVIGGVAQLFGTGTVTILNPGTVITIGGTIRIDGTGTVTVTIPYYSATPVWPLNFDTSR